MSEILHCDPRFQRGRCEFCKKLFPAEQTAIYKLTRVADSVSRRARLCFTCAHSMPTNFIATPVKD